MDKNENVKSSVCVIGGGIIGLSTALRLVQLNKYKTFDITIVAEKFGTETTSDGAGGLFRPDANHIKGVDKNLLKKMSIDSFKYFNDLLFDQSQENGSTGIMQLSGYQLYNEPREDPTYKDIIYSFKHLTQSELKQFDTIGNYKYGYFSTTICVDVREHMTYLTNILKKHNVKFTQRRIESIGLFLNESDYDVLFNCAGLGSQQLCDDAEMVPVRGHMTRVYAPWIKHFYYLDVNCYIIPNMTTVCLGGTRQFNNSNLDINESESKEIFKRCKTLCPSLENAKVNWHWVGLRPYREPIRIEKEIYTNNGSKNVTVIHNYGHGANGIALSRGCAIYAVDLLFN